MPLRRAPLPSPSLRPVLSTSLIFSLQGRFPPLRVLRFLPLPFVQFSPRSDTASSTDLSALVHSCFPPLPSRSFPFLASGSRRSFHFVPHTASRFVLLPFPRISPRDSSSASVLVFPVAGSVSLFLSFLLRFLQLPSPSFPFLSSSSLQFSPLSSSSVLPSSSRPHGVPTLRPFSFRIPGSAAALSRLGFCGPRVAPRRPHTTPEKRQSCQGREGYINLSRNQCSLPETRV